MPDHRSRNTLVNKLARVSLGTIYDVATHPTKLPMLMHAPVDATPVRAASTLIQSLTADAAEALRLEFVTKHDFFEEYARRYVSRRGALPKWLPMWEFMYIVVRALRPTLVVETGVFDGQSSAVILQALADNSGNGRLVSIDLPATATIGESTDFMVFDHLPTGCDPGWVIPDRLRPRHDLILGDSRLLLREVLAKEQEIDVFFHDSLHTFAHMTYEYETAWPSLRDGGLLLSDDVTWNAAFHRFCKKHHREYVIVAGVGGMRK